MISHLEQSFYIMILRNFSTKKFYNCTSLNLHLIIKPISYFQRWPNLVKKCEKITTVNHKNFWSLHFGRVLNNSLLIFLYNWVTENGRLGLPTYKFRSLHKTFSKNVFDESRLYNGIDIICKTLSSLVRPTRRTSCKRSN